MNNRLEDRIRDFLAQHLDLLESGLTLVKVEYPLPTKIGASGRIDILAKDKFGNFLVIEIKRSDQAARQALNEMFKYTGLFQRNQGLDKTKVRLFVVSTHWHELLLPLSGYVEIVEYALQGFKIAALPDGTVTSASRVSFVPSVEAVDISCIQGVYLSETADKGNHRAIALTAAAKRIGIEDFVILSCEHSGSDPAVAFGHALWFCFSSPFRTMSKPDIAQLKQSIDWDDDLDQPEENFLCTLNQDSGAFCDTFEIGYPEKLTNLERTWKLSVQVREGRLGSRTSLLNDDEIIRLAKKVDGGSHVYFSKMCSPHLKAAWSQMLVDLRLSLKGNSCWETIIPALLKKVASESPDVAVSISLYNPCNLLLSLYDIAWRSNYSKCAFLEICVEDQVKKQFTIFASSLAWNGKPVAATPEAIVKNVYGLFEIWCADSVKYEDKALPAHGLSTPIVAFTFRDQSGPVVCGVKLEGGKLVFSHDARGSLPTLEGFATANQAYLKSLKAYLESNSVGLPGSCKSDSSQSPQ